MRTVIAAAADQDKYKIDWSQYDEAQARELRYSLSYRLPVEKMALLLDPRFESKQMGELRSAIFDELSMEQLQIIANYEIPWQAMWELRKCWLRKIPDELVKLMAKTRLSDVQIKELRVAYEAGTDLAQLVACIRMEAEQNGYC